MARRAWYVLPATLAGSLLIASCGGGGSAGPDSAAQSAPGAVAPSGEEGAESFPGISGDVGGGTAAGAGVGAADGAGARAAGAPSGARDAGAAKAAGARTAGAGSKAVAGTAGALARPGAAEPRTASSPSGTRPAGGAAARADRGAPSGKSAGAAAGQAAPVAAADRQAYERTGGATDVGVTKDGIRLGSVNMHGMAMANLITQPVVRGNMAAIQAINDRGGVLGRRLSLVDCDDGPGDTARAKSCIKKLAENDKIFSLIGGIDWATASIHDDLRHFKLPYVGAWAYSQTEWQDPYMFPTHMSMIHEAMAGANWVVKVIKPKTYGMICLTSPEMQLACEQVRKIMDAAGIKLAKKLDVAISEPTMSPHIVALRAAAPDHIIHYVINPATMAKMMIEAEQQNYYPPMGLSGNHLASEAVGPLFGKFGEGRYWTNTTYKLWGTEYTAVMSRYARANKGMNHHIVQSSYVGLNFLASAAKAVGPNLTRERMMAQLNNGEVWKADASLDQKFSWAPTERYGDTWRDDLGQGREFMYKYSSPNTSANPDGTPSGWVPDPGQFVITTR